MKKITTYLYALLLVGLISCSSESPKQDTIQQDDIIPDPTVYKENPVSKNFTYNKAGQDYIFSYEGTHDINQANNSITRCVFSFHGASRNPDVYFDNMVEALKIHSDEKNDSSIKNNTMVIAPHLLSKSCFERNSERYSNGYYPYWGSGWRAGDDSTSSPAISDFELIDQMLLTIHNNFPNIKTIVLAGHSAGAQVLSRYALTNRIHENLEAAGCKIVYIVANPSSLVYLDMYRPNLESETGFKEITINPCGANNFNAWKYGLENIYPFPAQTPITEMIENFKTRDVVFLMGGDDVDENSSSLDKSCEGKLQGRYRLERGQRYYEYLGFYYGDEIYSNKFLTVVPGVSHSNGDMFQSEGGRQWIFDFE